MAVIDIIIAAVVVIVKNGGITTTIVEVVDMTVVGLVVTEVMTEAVVIEVVIEACGRHRLLLRGGLEVKIEILPVGAVGLTKHDHLTIDAIRHTTLALLLQPQPRPQLQ